MSHRTLLPNWKSYVMMYVHLLLRLHHLNGSTKLLVMSQRRKMKPLQFLHATTSKSGDTAQNCNINPNSSNCRPPEKTKQSLFKQRWAKKKMEKKENSHFAEPLSFIVRTIISSNSSSLHFPAVIQSRLPIPMQFSVNQWALWKHWTLMSVVLDQKILRSIQISILEAQVWILMLLFRCWNPSIEP